jgi:tetratricopeptide (TPR) repeat protein
MCPSLREDLQELYLDDAVKLLSCFITGGDALKPYLAGDKLNTENNPVIEFESPRYGYEDKPVIDNLKALMAIQVSPMKFMAPGSIPPKEAERLDRYAKALPHVISGHNHLRAMELEDAARDWMEAAKLTPEDLSLTRNQLTFPVLQKRIKAEPSNPFNYQMLGRVYMLEGRLDYAYDLLRRSVEIMEFHLGEAKKKGVKTDEGDKELAKTRQWLAEVTRQLEARGGKK